MYRYEAIEWLKSIKEKYISGGDDWFDYQRRKAIDYAVAILEVDERRFAKDTNVLTNSDRIRAMSDEELAVFLRTVEYDVEQFPFVQDWDKWLQQPVKED